MPLWRVDPPLGQQPQPLIHKRQQGRQGKHPQPDRRKFDCQRQAIEVPTNRNYFGSILVGQDEIELDRTRPFNEESDSRNLRQLSYGRQVI
jgi:hypothetical protein